MPLKSLERALSEGLQPLYVVLGDVDLLVRRAEATVEAAVLGAGGSTLNRDVFRAGEEGADEVLGVVRTLPMLASRRLVLLRDAEEAPASLLESLTEYCAAPVDSATLVITGRKWPAPVGGTSWGRRLENAAKKAGLLLRVKSKEQNPVSFARSTASDLGCELGQREANVLVQVVGNDLGRIQCEVEKLCTWKAGEGRISSDDVAEVCSVLAEAVVWDLTDALVRGQVDAALASAHRLLEGGEPAHRLLFMVTWQLRQLLRLQEALERGVSPSSVGIRMHPRKLREAEQQLSRARLHPAATLDLLTRANQAMNSSKAGDRRIFEGLVLQILARRAGRAGDGRRR